MGNPFLVRADPGFDCGCCPLFFTRILFWRTKELRHWTSNYRSEIAKRQGAATAKKRL